MRRPSIYGWLSGQRQDLGGRVTWSHFLEQVTVAPSHRDRYRISFSSMTDGPYARETYTYWALWEADYLGARPLDNRGLDDLRLTGAGRETLNPVSRSPMDEARHRLVNQSKVDAIIHAVEVGWANASRPWRRHTAWTAPGETRWPRS